MQGKNKISITLIILVVVAALGYGSIRFFGTVSLAEGYLHEYENRLVYAKVAPSGDEVSVEVVDTKVETEDSIPVIKSNTIAYAGSIDGSNLILKAQPDQSLNATVSKDELVFLGPLAAGDGGKTRLVASPAASYQEKLGALTARVNGEAEQKKKELAEKKAKEEARVQFAKQVERTTKLQADLVENGKYLTDLHFSDETTAYKEQLAELQLLLDEITVYAGQPDLKKTEFEVMEETAGSMKVLLDGMDVIDANTKAKKKSMTAIMAVLETDLADTKTSWEEIKGSVPNPDAQLKAHNDAIKAGSQAMAQAKERIASIEKEQTVDKKKAAQLYQNAVGILSQTKAKHHF